MAVGAFERLGARIDERLDGVWNRPTVRILRQVGRTVSKIAIYVGSLGTIVVIDACVGGAIADVSKAVLHAIGWVGPVNHNLLHEPWTIWGAALFALSGGGIGVYAMTREYLENRAHEREPAAAATGAARLADMSEELRCPQCNRFVGDTGKYTSGGHHARHQRATCEGCGAELLRHPDLPENGWIVEKSGTTPPDGRD